MDEQSSELYKQVASAFSQTRALRGDSLRDVAADIGVSISTMSRVERGVHVNVSLETLVALLRYIDPENPIQVLSGSLLSPLGQRMVEEMAQDGTVTVEVSGGLWYVQFWREREIFKLSMRGLNDEAFFKLYAMWKKGASKNGAA